MVTESERLNHEKKYNSNKYSCLRNLNQGNVRLMKHLTIPLAEVNSPVCLFAFSVLLGQRSRTGQRRVKGKKKRKVNNWMMLQSHSNTHVLCWAITSSTEKRLLYFLLFTSSFFSSHAATLLISRVMVCLCFTFWLRRHFVAQFLPQQFVQCWNLHHRTIN